MVSFSETVKLFLIFCITLKIVQPKTSFSFFSNDFVFEVDEYKNPSVEYLYNGTEIFLEAARSFSQISDKVTTHSYETMYGRFLRWTDPYKRRQKRWMAFVHIPKTGGSALISAVMERLYGDRWQQTEVL